MRTKRDLPTRRDPAGPAAAARPFKPALTLRPLVAGEQPCERVASAPRSADMYHVCSVRALHSGPRLGVGNMGLGLCS